MAIASSLRNTSLLSNFLMHTNSSTRASIPKLVVATLFVLALPATDSTAQTEVQRWVDENGLVHYSDSVPEGSASVDARTVLIDDPGTSFGALPATANLPANADPGDDLQEASTPPTSLPAADVNCATESPNLRFAGDIYAVGPEELPPLPENELALVQQFMSSMRGRWQGSDEGFSCEQADGSIQQVPHDRRIFAEGDYNPPNNFILDMTIESRGSNRRELSRIAIEDGQFEVDRGITTLLAISERLMAFGYVLRMGGTVSEFEYRIHRHRQNHSDTMTIDVEHYINGSLQSLSQLKLLR